MLDLNIIDVNQKMCVRFNFLNRRSLSLRHTIVIIYRDSMMTSSFGPLPHTSIFQLLYQSKKRKKNNLVGNKSTEELVTSYRICF